MLSLGPPDLPEQVEYSPRCIGRLKIVTNRRWKCQDSLLSCQPIGKSSGSEAGRGTGGGSAAGVIVTVGAALATSGLASAALVVRLLAQA
jgi:hypothetical protein